MKELDKIIEKYFSKDGDAIVYYSISQKEFTTMIQNMGRYERPDILSIYNNKIVGIEHFEFDSYKNTKKGSNYQIQDSLMETKIKKEIEERLKKEKSIQVHGKIEGSSTLDNYYNNFEKHFKKHYSEIDSYIKNIRENFDCTDKTIEFWFFVEDVSPLGSYFLDKERKMKLLYPIYSDNIITLLKNSPKLKGIILGTYAMKEYKLIIINNNKKTLSRFSKEKQNVTDKDFVNFAPMTTGFVTRITKEELQGVNND